MARTPGRVVYKYTGRSFYIEQVPYTQRDGAPAEREVLVHPGSVVVLAVDEFERVVLLRNRRVSVGAVLWELPAGTLEEGEEPAVGAARELHEEAGLGAERLVPLCGFYAAPGLTDERMHAFLATGLTELGAQLEDDEDLTAERVPLPRALEMLREGIIQDAKTLAVLLYWRHFGAP